MILLNFHADGVRIRGLRAVFALAVLALGACAPAPVRPPPPPLDAAQQAANEAKLGDEWGFHGKVALSLFPLPCPRPNRAATDDPPTATAATAAAGAEPAGGPGGRPL